MRRIVPLVLCVLPAAMFGCGSADEHSTPKACLSGPGFYFTALDNAIDVTFQGDTTISDCLVENQSAGDLATVGGSLVDVATRLNARARRNPASASTFQLGYLVGAVEKGASDTHGIHAELLRRVEAAALYGPAGKPPPPPFDQAYRKGYAAGKDRG
jgi:hypothetical protein